MQEYSEIIKASIPFELVLGSFFFLKLVSSFMLNLDATHELVGAFYKSMDI